MSRHEANKKVVLLINIMTLFEYIIAIFLHKNEFYYCQWTSYINKKNVKYILKFLNKEKCFPYISFHSLVQITVQNFEVSAKITKNIFYQYQ